jgi:hypothetical protein
MGAVWPMKVRARIDQNTNTIEENIQQIQYKNGYTGNITHNTGSTAS